MTITKNQKIVIETTSVIAGIAIVLAVLLLSIFPSEVSEIPPSGELPTIPIIDLPTSTPTPTPSPTSTVTASPIPTPTPKPALFYWGTGGGGGGYRKPQVPVEELTGLQICDVNGSNCKRESIDPLIDIQNIKPGDKGVVNRQLKNDNEKSGIVYLQIISESTDSEIFKEYFYLEVVFNNKTITGNLSELEELKRIGGIQEKQSLPLEMKWYFSKDAGNELQGKKINKFKIFFGLAEE